MDEAFHRILVDVHDMLMPCDAITTCLGAGSKLLLLLLCCLHLAIAALQDTSDSSPSRWALEDA